MTYIVETCPCTTTYNLQHELMMMMINMSLLDIVAKRLKSIDTWIENKSNRNTDRMMTMMIVCSGSFDWQLLKVSQSNSDATETERRTKLQTVSLQYVQTVQLSLSLRLLVLMTCDLHCIRFRTMQRAAPTSSLMTL